MYEARSGCGRIVLTLSDDQVDSVCHSGPNDAAVAALRSEPDIEYQTRTWDPAVLTSALREFGAWEPEELADHDANISRMIWNLCWDVYEEPEWPEV